MSKDYYKILGVEKNANQDEIKKAFRQKAHQFHPDKAGGDEAKFKELNEAYQVLGDQKKRSQYDQFGSTFEQARAGGGFSGFEGFRDFSGFTNGFNINMDDLGDMFGGLGDIFGFSNARGKRRTRAHRGNDIQIFLTIEFKEAVFGTEKEISLKKNVSCHRCEGSGAEPGTRPETCKTCGGSGRVIKNQRTIFGNIQVQSTCPECGSEGKTYKQKCSQCHGSCILNEVVNLKVKIPAGIDNGETIRLSGQGEAGASGGPTGDLYLRIRVNPDKRFERQDYNILSYTEISFTQAALGAKIDLETVDGTVTLKIPEGTQSGRVFMLKGKGIPKLRGRGRGDHLVEVKVKTPTNLTKKQKDVLKDLGI